MITEHDVYFIQFEFYKIKPLITRTEEGGLDYGQYEGQFASLAKDVFSYDTRTEELDDTIRLPLKSTVNEEVTANFEEASTRKLSSVAQALDPGAESRGLADIIMTGLRQSKMMPEEIRRGLDAATATAVNERMQVFYTGPNRRGYTFEFPLAAKNIKDARELRKIAKRWQYHASPSLGNSGTTWNYPNMVSFKFHRHVYDSPEGVNSSASQTQGQPRLEEIDTLFESKKCFIESVSVTHGDDRFVQYTDGTDYETGIMTISVTLKEADYFLQDDFKE